MKNIGIQMKDGNNNNVYPNPFPVGAIYMSIDSRNPSQIFGGKWEQIKDRFLLSAGAKYTVGTTGGEEQHTLTINEMPKHNHAQSLNDNGTRSNWAGYDWGITNTSRDYAGSDLAQYAGGSQPHNNMPPYFVVYVWRRTA